jgi:dihydroorotate dehydrogenase electron transfer subunit
MSQGRRGAAQLRSIVRDGLVLSVGFMAPGQVRMVVEDPEVALAARPGQFVEVGCSPAFEGESARSAATRAPFLRRPISFCDVDRAAGTFTLAFRVQGVGTEALSRFRSGDRLSYLGPLGHGFLLPESGSCLAVGGGIGVYPLLLLLRDAQARGLGTAAVCGYRSPEDAFLLDEFRSVSDRTFFASDTGGLDFTGHAAAALEAFLAALRPAGPVTVFTCGPYPMMRTVASLCEREGHACQVSLEERMGCGTGICLVCACKVRSLEKGEPEYRRCCTEGPVFDAREVVWE